MPNLGISQDDAAAAAAYLFAIQPDGSVAGLDDNSTPPPDDSGAPPDDSGGTDSGGDGYTLVEKITGDTSSGAYTQTATQTATASRA